MEGRRADFETLLCQLWYRNPLAAHYSGWKDVLLFGVQPGRALYV